jgi:hypothetical protein
LRVGRGASRKNRQIRPAKVAQTAADGRVKASYPGFRAPKKVATVAASYGSSGNPSSRNKVLLMKKIIIGTIVAVSLSAIAAASATAQVANSPQYAQLKSPSAQSTEKLDMSAVPALDRNKVQRVQSALRAKGFDPGPLNGVVGAKTKEAVQKFQDRFGIKATGTIDNQTLFALGVVGDKSAAVEEEPRPEPKQPRNKAHRASTNSPQSARRSIYSGARSRSRWCALYRNGSQSCGFSTLQQCQATVSGVGGSCQSE